MTRYSFDEADAEAIAEALTDDCTAETLLAHCVPDPASPTVVPIAATSLLAHLGTAPATDVDDAALSLAVPFVEAREGCKLTSYHGSADRPGVWTVGNGFIEWNGKPVGPGLTITQAENDAALRDKLGVIAAKFKPIQPASATPGQLAALYSFAWNLGSTATLTSTLVKDWRAGNVSGASTQFALWDHADGKVVPGLITRRALERALFLSV